VAGDAGKLAWVSAWRRLPHLTAEVQRQFDYPQQFAEDVFDRIERALGKREADGGTRPLQTGRLVILPETAAEAEATHWAEAYEEAQLLNDRREGRCLISYRAAGGWAAIGKGILTEALEAGRDATIGGLTAEAAEALRLLYPQLVVWRRERDSNPR
jgi:hypothetical protein